MKSEHGGREAEGGTSKEKKGEEGSSKEGAGGERQPRLRSRWRNLLRKENFLSQKKKIICLRNLAPRGREMKRVSRFRKKRRRRM